LKKKAIDWLSNKWVIFGLLVLLVLFASIQSYFGTLKSFENEGRLYTHYNNYIVFKNSFIDLVNGKNLYVSYPERQWEIFLYTPSFAVFFGLFTYLPDSLGLVLWNMLNAIILFASFYYLPKFSPSQKGIMMLVVIIELMTSLQNEQSNALIAGLIIFSFGLLEKQKYFLAVFVLILAFYIKLFALVGVVVFLFYENKFRLFSYIIFWFIIIGAIPLIFIDFTQYRFLLDSYMAMLLDDHSKSLGLSVMGLLNSWFSIEINKLIVVGLGALLMMIPLFKFKAYKSLKFRMFMLISILLWIVIFNHKAESPTFIIALSGVAIWYTIVEKNYINIFLFVLCILLTCLSPTDVFPKFIRDSFVNPYSLKALPCVLIWFAIVFQQLRFKLLSDE
jgi:hypothetical protein